MDTLENNPILRKLLKEYVKMHYEENANYWDSSLIQEYELLKRENRLNELFELETMLFEWQKDEVKDDMRTHLMNLTRLN